MMAYYQGKMDEGVAKYNATQQMNEATQVKVAGAEAENMLREEGAKKISRQRTQLAAGGVDVGSSGAQDIQQATQLETEADSLRIRRNTEAQATAIKQGAALTLLTGKNAKKMAYLRGIAGAVGTAQNAVSSIAGGA
jgi:hypothetical protein